MMGSMAITRTAPFNINPNVIDTWMSIPSAKKTASVFLRLQNLLGGMIRDSFFMPLFLNLSDYHKNLLREEELFFSRFWDKSVATLPNMPYHTAIRELFKRNEVDFSFDFEGKEISIKCLVIEPIHSTASLEEEAYNFVHVLGNLSTISNNIMSTYPFLAAYLEKIGVNPNGPFPESIPSSRFIIISQYNTRSKECRFKPGTLNEAGKILAETVIHITKTYGHINQLVAHSLGSIVFTAALKYLRAGFEALPRNILLDRGPSSILKLSHRNVGGWIYFPLAFFTGWTMDFGEEVFRFIRNMQSIGAKTSLLISGSPRDHRFPRECNLYQSPQVQQLFKEKKIQVLAFNPPEQVAVKESHHTLSPDVFTNHYLLSPYEKQEILEDHETLAHAVIRRSLEESLSKKEDFM